MSTTLTQPPIVLLAVDPGATSGWALYEGERVIGSGVARDVDGRHEVVRAAAEWAAGITRRDLWVAIEKHTVGSGGNRRWTPATMLGMGAARGRWFEHFDAYGVRPSRLLEPTPAEWRGVALGGMRRRTTEEAKASAVAVARGLARRASVQPDEAEAICIGWWGVRTLAAKAAERRQRTKTPRPPTRRREKPGRVPGARPEGACRSPRGATTSGVGPGSPSDTAYSAKREDRAS